MTKYFSAFLLGLILVGGGCAAQPVQPVDNEAKEQEETLVLVDGTYTLDVSSSRIGWEASKVKVTHNGTIDPKEGSVRVQEGAANEGNVVVDMTTLKNLDQEGKFLELLQNHLRSNDFFAVQDNPTSTFDLMQIEPLSGIEGANYRIDGTLTIKGIKQPLSFPAFIEETGSGLRLTANVMVDRTLYDIRFGSGKFFENLGDNLIDDEFYLDLDLRFTPVNE